MGAGSGAGANVLGRNSSIDSSGYSVGVLEGSVEGELEGDIHSAQQNQEARIMVAAALARLSTSIYMFVLCYFIISLSYRFNPSTICNTYTNNHTQSIQYTTIQQFIITQVELSLWTGRGLHRISPSLLPAPRHLHPVSGRLE